MAVTHDDVIHIAELARLNVAADKLDGLVEELNGILAHMDVLSQVKTDVPADVLKGGPGTPLRADTSGPIPMLAPVASFAKSVRDGFFVVPRIATHEDEDESAS
jgi:aspartyl-tRNA(Asn)/glutamyl-tRNA(Gln) amidotransferase subunit C